MLKLVDPEFQPAKPAPSLTEIARQVRHANEHLAAANEMLSGVALEDRAKLQFAIFGAMAKLSLVVATLVSEVSAKREEHRHSLPNQP